MANAVKLPSGAWRTRANKVINGKTIRKSFTVHPKECGNDSKKAKARSELLAREWVISKEDESINGYTVKQAIDNYIDNKSKVLSPSTILGYKKILGAFDSIWDIYISDIDTPLIQSLVNKWSGSYKTKTIKNRVSFLLAVLDFHEIYKKFKISYPQNDSKKVLSPDIEDVKKIIENASGDMKAIIYLAAFGSLRRGEIAGLRPCDISRDMNTVTVNGDVVLSSEGWVYKKPKTESSIRTVYLPKFVIDSIPESDNEFIFNLSPTAITDRFRRLTYKLGLNYSLHSLRHFAASFRTDLGIPTKYIEEVGGWKNESTVLKRIYDNTLTSSRKKYTRMANDYIEENFN